ncbi:Cell cycle-associated protein [Ceraceosorus bombacis]|uniref:Cell cycle-associated protein n=1 Tax=Ceraceosorus bombacis TaxID=401625 RepID=A0A0P1BGU6_9BASI|nr:Cell cycle-associated protein [Ceraceosorus bombacis]
MLLAVTPSERLNEMVSSTAIPHRIRKGQTYESAFPTPVGPASLSSHDGPFQLQEYIEELVRTDPHDVDKIVAVPEAPEKSSAMDDHENGFGGLADEPKVGHPHDESGVDTDVWVYEQLRRIVQDFNSPWLVALQRSCSRTTSEACSGMAAADWEYLCASHEEGRQCCAIDYVVHTLDGTTSLLNSARHFPSRTYVPTTSLRYFGSVARRLGRCFTHAWQHHRDAFVTCEAETSLYARFRALVAMYDLLDVDGLPPLPGASNSSSSQEQAASSSEDDFSSRVPRSGGGAGKILDLSEPVGEEEEEEEDVESDEDAEEEQHDEAEDETASRKAAGEAHDESEGRALLDRLQGVVATSEGQDNLSPTDGEAMQGPPPVRSPGLAPGAGRRELPPEDAPMPQED